MGNQTSVICLVLMLDPWYTIRFLGVWNDLSFSGKKGCVMFRILLRSNFIVCLGNITFHFLVITEVVSF